MKRLLIGCVVVALLLLLAGCGGFEEGPDYKSLYDSGTGLVFSLHESRESVEEKLLGAGMPAEEPVYLDGTMVIHYNADGEAVYIRGYGERFSTLDFTPGMTFEETARAFPSVAEGESYTLLRRYYDKSGRQLEEGDASYWYVTQVLFEEEAYQSIALESFP